ncbi:histidine kinase [bacterium AH-315-C20]|nr:histidine kinase [bacterium AH-315-C20]
MRIYITLILWNLFYSGYSQELVQHSINYNVKDGLPSSQVYDIVEDDLGFMWFATDRGISKFNGYDFVNYTSNDGLTGTSIFKFFKDYKNRIWCLGWVNRLCYIENGQIHQYEFNSVLEDSLPRSYQEVRMHLDSLDNLHFVSRSGYCVISAKGEFKWIHERSRAPAINFRIQSYIVEDKVLSIKTAGWQDSEANKVIVYSKNKKLYELPYNFAKLGVFYSLLDDRNIYTLIDTRVIKASRENLLEKKFDKRLIYISKLDSQVFVGLYQGGGAFLNMDLTITKRILSQYSITSAIKDSQGGTWYSTLESGVLYFPKSTVFQERSSVESVSVIKVGKEKWVAYTDGTIAVYSNDSLKQIIDLTDAFEFRNLNALKYDSRTQEIYYCLASTAQNVGQDIQSMDKIAWSQNVSIINDSLSYGNWAYGLLKYVNGSLDTIIRSDANIRCQLNLGPRVFVGTVHGLYELVNDSLISFEQHSLFKERIQIMKHFEDHLLIGTLGAGLLICREGHVQSITTSEGLSSNDITAIFASEENIWLGSSRGVDLIKFEERPDAEKSGRKGYFARSYKNFPNARINDILVEDSKIWIATSEGLKILRSDELNLHESKLYITDVTINGEKYKPREEAPVLDYYENKLVFDFVAINYEASGNLGYQYRLLGFEDRWTFTNEREVNYLSLPPGKYTFEVKVQEFGGVWSAESAKYEFEIEEAFWRSTTFFVLSVCGALLLVLISFLYLRRRYALRAKVVELQSQAIMLQISPHFIFNALNSIRKYVYENVDLADHYITRFSKLMRRILNSSSEKFTSIADEVELLDNYISLEQMRASKEFDYKLIVDDEINKEFDTIPNLIIQPFVENSIVHGLLKKGGCLEIQIMKVEEGLIQCIITDNCGGFNGSEIVSNRGTGITINRLKIISRKSSINIDSGFVNSSGKKGTMVTINFRS